MIELDLCPFAAPVVEQGLVDYWVTDVVEETELFRVLLQTLNQFQQRDPQTSATGFLILSTALPSFLAFNDFFERVDHALSASGLNGIIQIVGFHPGYRFAGSGRDDPANYTNRSPYPMFHLIREDELESAVASHPDPGSIPERNVKLLRQLGLEEMQRRLDACHNG